MCRLSYQQRFHLTPSTGCQLEVSKYNRHQLVICSYCITFYHLGAGVIPPQYPPQYPLLHTLIAFPNVVRQPLLAESCLCQPSILEESGAHRRFLSTIYQRRRVGRMLTQDTGSINAGFIHGLVGIDAFVSRLLSSVRFVDGGDEGKSPSTDSSIPTIVDTSNSSRSNRTRRISLWHIGIGS